MPRPSHEIQSDMDATMRNMEPYEVLLRKLTRERDEALSREWIAANNVTLDQVFLATVDPDMPWFGSIWAAAEHIAKNGVDKRFIEWNGRLYFTVDAVNNRMPPENGRIEHVPGYTAP